MTARNAGFDYGMGQTNIDPETGIRYGVISQHSVSPDALDDTELDYGDPTCPKCGNPAVGSGDQTLDAVDTSGWETACGECPDYACPNCHLIFGGESAYGDAPIGYYTDDGEYKVINCLDSDLMVILSPYYTRAQFCSPCCPGAGSLDNPMADGIKTYCLGQDWFEDGQAPYPVFRLADDVLIPNSPLPKTCDQCAALGINGVFCHETGCPNVRKVWDGVAGEWVTPAADDIEQDDNGLDSLED